jgi:hypothetical protein
MPLDLGNSQFPVINDTNMATVQIFKVRIIQCVHQYTLTQLSLPGFRQELLKNNEVDFIVFMEWYLTCIVKTL